MSFRRFSLRRSIVGAPALRLVLPAVAFAIGAFAWRRFAPQPPMPRLPIRKQPPPHPAARAHLKRSSAPAPDVVVPHSFWDAGELAELEEDEHDDPAEIPYSGLPLVSEASQSAARLDPADHEPSSAPFHW